MVAHLFQRVKPVAPTACDDHPRLPTDAKPADLIAGRVTRGGSGPCWTVETDDGVTYALHGPGAGSFPTGSYVRARINRTPTPEADCGPGRAARIVSIEPMV